ncbi:uncharacterized protein EI97DRAFT_432342 [Westerdykella ornata]|uniref:NADH-ubiquinone oxidoreductase 178 kDa subunit n=1 Tax=Westerdykella ornata TaxID=318751 RepID=A0A6A6JMY0_WESOR|nr:uncharacterized protein EI97DRAFT_432342 [Westerdykella ornata]KAF2277473.1 hypothetical protein EI97DRAFT_432342 [Westerdykella ornata]
MQPLRRTALNAARRGKATLPRAPRRYAHEDHGHGHHSAPVNEPMGAGFWFTVGLIPAAWLVYKVAQPNEDGTTVVGRLIDAYTEKQEELIRINAAHADMIERAGRDRVLFQNTKPWDTIELKYPEIMNHGSPFNVQAGSQVNMDAVIAKFQKEAYEDNERKLEALRNNQIKSEQPFEFSGPRYRGVQISEGRELRGGGA